MRSTLPIDAVITWVNGNDPAHKEKMKPYLDPVNTAIEEVASPTRFNSNGEIYFCIASILRFAPYIRKIFIVTDNQDPEIDSFLHKNFPENTIPVEIVDHRVIFRDYEGCLPVFNSRAIETCLFRIPQLSEHFIYFNDDLVLMKPTVPEDWFIGDKLIIRGQWRMIAPDALLSALKPHKQGQKRFGFKDGMRKAAQLTGMKWRYLYMFHTPHTGIKSLLENYYTSHPRVFETNISYRFRNGNQYNPQTLSYLLALQANRYVLKKDRGIYMKPVKRGESYVERKIQLQQEQQALFACIQSLDQASEADRKRVFDWLEDVLSVHL